METNVRVLTVSSALRCGKTHYHTVPRINLEGNWLENAGFQEGDKVALSVKEKKITIVLDELYDNEKSHRAILNLHKDDLKEGDVVVQYKDKRGLWRKEMLSTWKEGEFYRVSAIPYRVPGIALHDLIEAEEENGVLFFSRIVEVGGNRVVHLLLYEKFVEEQLVRDLLVTGCTWLSRYQGRMTINIPLTAPFDKIIAMFDWGTKSGYWVYQQTRF